MSLHAEVIQYLYQTLPSLWKLRFLFNTLLLIKIFGFLDPHHLDSSWNFQQAP